MSDSGQFMMGEHRADFPADRSYARNHMWAQPWPQTESGEPDGGSYRFGLTSYAVRLLQDVYFLDWIVEANTAVKERQEIGSIESKKAESDLFSPVAGDLVAINDEALEDPSIINVDPYGDGWLFQITPTDSISPLLSLPDYLLHLESAWEVAQRTIKGQANTND